MLHWTFLIPLDFESFVFRPVNFTCHIHNSRHHCKLFCFSQAILDSLERFDSHWHFDFGHKRSGAYGIEL